jgi:hypothetical protein
LSASALRTIRALWIEAARDAKYRPHRELTPGYVRQARQVQRQLLQLRRAGR